MPCLDDDDCRRLLFACSSSQQLFGAAGDCGTPRSLPDRLPGSESWAVLSLSQQGGDLGCGDRLHDEVADCSSRASWLVRAGELLERECIADVGKRLVAGEAFGLVHARLLLLVGRENGIVPVFVAQDLGNLVAPAAVPR